MKRIPWRLLLMGGVVLVGSLGYLYYYCWSQAIRHWDEGWSAYKAQHWRTAEAEFSEAIRVAPPLFSEKALLYTLLGDTRLKLKKYHEAIDDYSEAIRLDANKADAFRNRGLAYDQEGELERAIADLDEAIRLDPKVALAWYDRGIVYFHKANYDQSLADFGEAIRLNPKHANAYSARGNVYAKIGDEARSKADQEKAKANYDQSLANFGEAIRLNPKYAYAYSARGRVYAKIGDEARSKADQEKAAELNPALAKPAVNGRSN